MIHRNTKIQNLETFSWKDLSSSNQILLSKRIVAPAQSYKQSKLRNSRLPFIVDESDLHPAPPPSPVGYSLDQSQDDEEGNTLSSLDDWDSLSVDNSNSMTEENNSDDNDISDEFSSSHFILMLLQMKVLITKPETFSGVLISIRTA